MTNIAVLTGDLIDSTELSSEELEQRVLSIQSALDDWGGDHPNCFTRQSGDGWQAVIHPPHKALRVSLYIRAWLKQSGADRATRVSIATGAADLPSSQDLNAATDPVFVASGRGLRQLNRRTTFIHTDGKAIAAATRLADDISQEWSEAQARVMLHGLKGRATQAAIAEKLGMSQQAVQQALAAARYHALTDALDFIEKGNTPE